VRRRIQEIARRVSTLAQVYDHLLGTEMTRTLDFGLYSKSLCAGLADVQSSMQRNITLTCGTEHIPLDLDDATAIGIVLAEIVSNSFDHAFPDDSGTITVDIRRNPVNADFAMMSITDDGTGFTPKAESKRHGLGLVRRLIEQVNGAANLNSSNGTSWTIVFPINASSKTRYMPADASAMCNPRQDNDPDGSKRGEMKCLQS
jgi:two-component sensor histidine kinase